MHTKSMKRLLLLLATSMLFLLSACGNRQNSDPKEQGSDVVVADSPDEKAKDLFEKAAQEIIALASEEPATYLMKIFDEENIVDREEKKVNDITYYKTTIAYTELKDYYAALFTEDALEWILSTKFEDVDGVLYCSSVGGATGWTIENVKTEKIDQKDGSYIYQAVFNRVEGEKAPETETTSQFTIKQTENGYRISDIDYVPDLLTKE